MHCWLHKYQMFVPWDPYVLYVLEKNKYFIIIIDIDVCRPLFLIVGIWGSPAKKISAEY